MNKTQIQTTIAPIIAAVAGFLAGKGYFGWDAQTWIAILGGLGTVAATIWGGFAARQAAIISTTTDMPGVQMVTVNAQSNKTLAAIAVDEDNPKIEPTAGASIAVNAIAKGA